MVQKKHLEVIKNHGLTRYHRVLLHQSSSYINSHHNILI
jgi:hypothetical protein